MQAQQLPHNDYAETCAIGCLLESYSPDMLLSELVPEDFYSAANRIIFAAARDVASAGAPVGIFTITDRLRADGNLEKVGGPAYLERCANSVVSIAQVEGAVWGVRDAALLRNAIDAMEGEGSLTIEIVPEGPEVHIDITDTGKGIPTAQFRTVFQPGFTTKKRGWGLGLSLSKRIIEQYHGGRIFVKRSAPGKGTTFRITLNA